MHHSLHILDATTSIQLAGLTIMEPVTILSNLLITAVSLYAYIKMKDQATNNLAPKLFRLFFLFMALATTVGGIVGHGFLYAVGKYGKLPGWYLSMAAVAFFERAAIEHARPLLKPGLAKFFSVFNYIEIAAFAILAFITLRFRFVEAHATYGLFVVVFSLELYVFLKKKDKGSVYIFYGTALALIAALIHMLEISISPWFNYNDLSHVFMSIGVYFYYLSGVNFSFYKPKRLRIKNMFFRPEPNG